MDEIEKLCPAKVNLFLAVTGCREDGYHELVSVMAPIDLADRLRLSWVTGEQISFFCDDPNLPCDDGNLVLKAVAAFRRGRPFRRGLRIELEKNIPVGAGLGGGSSDAAGVLLGLNTLFGEPLSREDLRQLAATIGSDCPFFIDCEAAIVRGRGERVEVLPEAAMARLRGTRLFLMKPSFPISTAWAYGALAKRPDDYIAAESAEARLVQWLEGRAPVEELLVNNLEGAVFRKYIPLPTLKARLARNLRLPVLMSGSGSTLFAVLDERRTPDAGREQAEELARDALGAAGWMEEVRLL